MATGQTRMVGGIVPKKSAVPGKIPTGTTLGEIFSNLSDRKLWGYDGSNMFEYGSSSFLGLTGGTVTGATVFTNTLSAQTFTAVTIYVSGYNPSIPGISNAIDTNTGLMFDGPDVLSLHTGGYQRLLINAAGSISNGNFNVTTGFNTELSGVTKLDGLSATSISATTYYNIPTVFGTGANNNGGTITTGVTGYFVAGHAGRITGWELIGATSGSIVFDIWKTTGSTLPTVANSITDAAKPRITAGVYSGSTNLSAWSGLTYNAGDKFGFNIDSVSGFTTATLTIKGFKSN